VNAIEGRKTLKVLWFRRNEVPANAGFENIYWPSIVGTYSLRWPHEDPNWVSGKDTTIVLASNDGSGPLPSLEAKGSIYRQNELGSPRATIPNEEHAVMIGGQAYAIRDDLNILTGSNYSSDPYVLVAYPDEANRPRMRAPGASCGRTRTTRSSSRSSRGASSSRPCRCHCCRYRGRA
jgi:hypothetical protein